MIPIAFIFSKNTLLRRGYGLVRRGCEPVLRWFEWSVWFSMLLSVEKLFASVEWLCCIASLAWRISIITGISLCVEKIGLSGSVSVVVLKELEYI